MVNSSLQFCLIAPSRSDMASIRGTSEWRINTISSERLRATDHHAVS